MKAKVRIEGTNVKVEVNHREAVISHDRDFSVNMAELEQPGINEIMVYPRDLKFQIERKDGWVINIAKGVYDEQSLIVTRFKRPKVGGTLTSEYLTRGGKWLPEPPGYGPPPTDIMKIPVPLILG